MRIQKIRKSKYVKKARFYTSQGLGITHFFNENDIKSILKHWSHQKIDDKKLWESLNNVIKFLATIFIGLMLNMPSKKDEITLFKDIRKQADNLSILLKILCQYGCETYDLMADNASNFSKGCHVMTSDWNSEDPTRGKFCGIQQKCSPMEYITFLVSNLDRLSMTFVSRALNRLKESGARQNKGNRKNQANKNLIKELIVIYENLTGRKARDNFKQSTKNDRSTADYTHIEFIGDFYIFVQAIFIVIKSKNKTDSTGVTKIFSVNLNKNSQALGMLIREVMRQSKTEDTVSTL